MTAAGGGDDPRIGIGHFSLLDVSPPDLVVLAHRAGFGAVGVRAATAAPGEEVWPVGLDSPMLAETMLRLDDTGVEVLDVEIIRLTGETRPRDALPLLEIGAELGARFLNVFGDDADLARAHDNFAELVELSRPYGIRPAVEATTYTGIRRVQDAAAVSAGTGGGLIIDPLHLHRSGGTPADVARLDPAVLTYVQMCDCLLDEPHGLPPVTTLPRNQPLPTSDLQLEARAMRLLPGYGELPLTELLAALPPGLSVSVEVPNLTLLDQVGPDAFARQAFRAVAHVLSATSAYAE
jgi:sugar phosphate isomerase/epimerase